MSEVLIYKNRHNEITLDLGYDISGDTFASQIRSEPDLDGALIADFTPSLVTDGTDGLLLLTLTTLVTSQIAAKSGYMDLKRTTGGLDLAVFRQPLEVEFVGAVTE